MLVSYNWLNTYFDGKLPGPDKIAEALTFHAWEIDETKVVGNDTVFDIKILPDKAMWALSHRGVAKDLSVILNIEMAVDPLREETELKASGTSIGINIETDACRRFAAARIKGVKVGPSPEWLKTALEAIGQRSINNIVDASNYVMFNLGQPSHAFDAALVGESGFKVRAAKEGETLTGLDEKDYALGPADTVIARLDTDEALSIAGIKGGKQSGISEATTDILVEVANWDPVRVRKTGQRLKLRTDASARYENGIVPGMVPFGLKAVVELILEVAGGELVSVNEVRGEENRLPAVSVSLAKINSVLGVQLTADAVTEIMDRFGWSFKQTDSEFVIEPPFWRTDLAIAEDLIEEIGRVYGYEHVAAVRPEITAISEVNQRFYYSEQLRNVLLRKGFSEIYTSSFRSEDEVKLANAFAADKGYLRSTLTDSMEEALAKNAPNADLLGLRQIRLFEIGTLFHATGERLMLALGVRSPAGYKAAADDPVLKDACAALSEAFGLMIEPEMKTGVAEIDFGDVLARLPAVTAYQTSDMPTGITYRPFSTYPAIARDIAMWVSAGAENAETIQKLLQETAGDLCVRVTLFDQFEKDGRVSYAFRLVFQSKEKTLTDGEVNAIMDGVYQAVSKRGFEVR